MARFPTDLLNPLEGSLVPLEDGEFAIEIPLAPFTLVIEPDEVEVVVTSLRLDFIRLPTDDLFKLAGEMFTFPKNPEDGYIDGSLYIQHAHHPVDVTKIRFGSCADGRLEVELHAALEFEFEGLGEFIDTQWVCRTALRNGVG